MKLSRAHTKITKLLLLNARQHILPCAVWRCHLLTIKPFLSPTCQSKFSERPRTRRMGVADLCNTCSDWSTLKNSKMSAYDSAKCQRKCRRHLSASVNSRLDGMLPDALKATEGFHNVKDLWTRWYKICIPQSGLLCWDWPAVVAAMPTNECSSSSFVCLLTYKMTRRR